MDELERECDGLAQRGDYGEAMRRLREFSPKLLPSSAREVASKRIEEALSRIEKKATDVVDACLREARLHALEGRLQRAADELARIENIGLPQRVDDAYQSLQQIADAWLRKQRRRCHEETQRELAERRKSAAAARPPKEPEKDWRRAEDLLAREEWSQALELLDSLAAEPRWRAQALKARARARFLTEDFVGLLQDAEALLEAGPAERDVVDLLERAFTRASIDETVLKLYERLVEKDPRQPELWTSMAVLAIWRHDADAAKDVVDRAFSKKVPFNGAQLDRISRFGRLRERSFPPRKAVYVYHAGAYEVLTDASPGHARKVAAQIAKIAGEYARAYPYSRNATLKSRVLFFAEYGDYNDYHRARYGESATRSGAYAFYDPVYKQLAMWDDRDRPGEVLTTLRHEALHQFLDYLIPECPPWMNEGTATYFEWSSPERAVRDAYHDFNARQLLSKFPPLKELLQMPEDRWNSDPLHFDFYSQAWSFIYYLHCQRKQDLLDEYFRHFMKGYPRETAFDRVFGKVDFAALERDWKAAVAAGEYGR